MSHLSEDCYKQKIEKVEQTETTKKECCYYELHDGSWLCMETTYEAKDTDWGKDWKRMDTKTSSCMDKPDDVSKEDHLKRLITVLKKY